MNGFGARRRMLAALAALPSLPAAGQYMARPPDDAPGQVRYPTVRRGVPLVFPRDFGAHPEYRTEWWYATGWLQVQGAVHAKAPPLGFQITFFRSRPQVDTRNPSRFAARELVLAHKFTGVEVELERANEVMQSLRLIWGRPVHLAMMLNEEQYFLSMEEVGGKLKKQRVNEEMPPPAHVL